MREHLGAAIRLYQQQKSHVSYHQTHLTPPVAAISHHERQHAPVRLGSSRRPDPVNRSCAARDPETPDAVLGRHQAEQLRPKTGSVRAVSIEQRDRFVGDVAAAAVRPVLAGPVRGAPAVSRYQRYWPSSSVRSRSAGSS